MSFYPGATNGSDYLCVGQAGLNMAARLQSLGVSNLIIDKNERIGDNWRNRYRVSDDLPHSLLELLLMRYLL